MTSQALAKRFQNKFFNTKKESCYLETVRCFNLTAHRIHFLLVDSLDLSQSLSHLVLPELAVLGRRVAVRQRRQLLHLLLTETIGVVSTPRHVFNQSIFITALIASGSKMDRGRERRTQKHKSAVQKKSCPRDWVI